jgi:hypothetical protein
MSRGISFIFSLILLAGTAIVADAQSNALARAQQVTGDRFTVRMRTPGGATIYAVRRPSDAMIEAIDDGLADLLAAALHRESRSPEEWRRSLFA